MFHSLSRVRLFGLSFLSIEYSVSNFMGPASKESTPLTNRDVTRDELWVVCLVFSF